MFRKARIIRKTKSKLIVIKQIEIMKTNIYDFVINLYTDYGNNLRPQLSRPGEINDKIYATDAHAIVRVNKSLVLKDYSDNEKFPSGDKIFNDFEKENNTTISTDEFMKEFFSTKLRLDDLTKDCDSCHGEGEMDCPCCGNETDCKQCDGQGQIVVEKNICRMQITGKDIIFLKKKFSAGLLFKVVHTALILKVDSIEMFTSSNNSVLFIVGECEIIVMLKQ